MHSKVNTPGEQLAAVLTLLPGEGQRNVRIDAERQSFLLPVESIFQPSPAAVLGGHFQVEAAAVEELLGLHYRLGAAQSEVSGGI